MALGLALRELQNNHPCTYVQGVLWYGVNRHLTISVLTKPGSTSRQFTPIRKKGPEVDRPSLPLSMIIGAKHAIENFGSGFMQHQLRIAAVRALLRGRKPGRISPPRKVGLRRDGNKVAKTLFPRFLTESRFS